MKVIINYLGIFKIIKASRFNIYSMFPCRLGDEATEFLEEFLEVTKQHNSVLEAKVFSNLNCKFKSNLLAVLKHNITSVIVNSTTQATNLLTLSG